MCSTGHKLDMAFREPKAHQTARTAYNSDGVTQRTVQVTAVTVKGTTVKGNKRNLKARGKDETAAAVAHLEETHTAQRTPYR
jgi:hypothetical protein